MRRLPHSGCATVCCVVATLFADTARATDPEGGQAESPQAADDKDAAISRARELFNEGAERAHRGDWVQALVAFERSYEVHPHAATEYNIAYCNRVLGRYTHAHEMVRKALSDNIASMGVVLPAEQATAARTYLADVDKQLAHAIVSLSPKAALMRVDGRPLELRVAEGPRPVLWAGTRELGPSEPTPSSTFEVVLDPGSHVIAISQAGYTEDVAIRNFEPGSEVPLVFQLSPLMAASSPNEGHAMEGHRAISPRTQKILGAAVGAAGLICLGIGSAFGLAAISEWSLAKQDCGGDPARCSDVLSGQSHRSAALDDATVSTISFVAGGVLLGSGAALFLTASPRDKNPMSTLVLTPRVGSNRAGLALSGVFE